MDVLGRSCRAWRIRGGGSAGKAAGRFGCTRRQIRASDCRDYGQPGSGRPLEAFGGAAGRHWAVVHAQGHLNVHVHPVAERHGLTEIGIPRYLVADDQLVCAQPRMAEVHSRDELVDLANAPQEVSGSSLAARSGWIRQ